MVKELIDWFEGDGTNNKGLDCSSILDGDSNNKSSVCPNLVLNTFQKVIEILSNYGYEF